MTVFHIFGALLYIKEHTVYTFWRQGTSNMAMDVCEDI